MKKFRVYHTEGALGNLGGTRKSNESSTPVIIVADDEKKARFVFSNSERTRIHDWKITRIEECLKKAA